MAERLFVYLKVYRVKNITLHYHLIPPCWSWSPFLNDSAKIHEDLHNKMDCSIFFILAGNPLGNPESPDDHCNKTVDIYVDVASPPVTYLNRNRPLTCWYRFKSIRGIPKDWVLRLTFKKFKVGTLINSTHCEGGYLQVSINVICYKTLFISFIYIKGDSWTLTLINNRIL